MGERKRFCNPTLSYEVKQPGTRTILSKFNKEQVETFDGNGKPWTAKIEKDMSKPIELAFVQVDDWTVIYACPLLINGFCRGQLPCWVKETEEMVDIVQKLD